MLPQSPQGIDMYVPMCLEGLVSLVSSFPTVRYFMVWLLILFAWVFSMNEWMDMCLSVPCAFMLFFSV